MCTTVMSNHVFISFSAVLEMYDLSYIHLFSSPSMGILQSDQLPVGMVGIAEVMGSNPVQA